MAVEKVFIYNNSSIIQDEVIISMLFWTPGLPKGVLSNRGGSLVIALVRLLVCPSLNISETVHAFFLIFFA